MNTDILISIVVPAYNSAKTIGATLESLKEQTYTNIEVIIIDGASNDKTIYVVEEYRRHFGDRLVVVSERDNGIYDAMNKGIQKAKGVLIGILSSNDTFEPQAVEHIVGGYDRSTPDCIVYGLQRYIANGSEEYIALYPHTNLPKRMMAHPSCFVAKSVYEKYGAFDTSYKSSADYEFLWRMYDNKDVVFRPVYGVIANFNTGGMSGTREGYLETIRLRYTKGQISKMRYFYIRLRCVISKIVKG